MLEKVFEKIIVALKKIIPIKWHYALEHAGFKRYFVNTSWMFFGQMFSMVISFFIGAWIARYLGPKNYGIINYSFAFVGIFSFIANLGIGTILSRDLVKYPEKRDELLGTSFRLLLYGGAAAFTLVVISAFVFESSYFIRSLMILYSSTYLWSAFVVIQTFFQSTVQAKKNVRISMAGAATSSILKVLLIVSGRGIVWLMMIFIFESILVSVLSVIAYKSSGYKFSAWRFDAGLAKDILSGSWLLMLGAAASFLFVRVDQVMVKFFLGETSVGLYAAAVRLVEVWYFVPGIICGSLLPAIINAKKVDEKKYYERLKKLYILLAFVAVLIAVPSTVLASWVINLLFGSAYSEAAGILRIYVWSGIGLFLLWGLQQYFLSENRLKIIFYLYLFSMITNIVLNLFFIPKFGLMGAAWATLISYSIGPIAVFVAMNTESALDYLKNKYTFLRN